MGSVGHDIATAIGVITAPIAVPLIMAKEKIEEKIDDIRYGIGSTKSYNEDSASETINLNELLSKFKSDIEEQSDELEKQVVKASSTQMDKFISQIKQINGIKIDGIPLRIDIAGIERRKRDQEKRIRGHIKNHVQQRISLVDSECLEILKMDKGDKKANAIEKFGKKVLREGVDELSADVKETINSMFEDVESTITDRLNTIEETLSTRMANYNRMKSALDNNTQEEEVCLCYKKNAIYSHILNILDEN